MIDLHSHVLPDLDDGPSTVAGSVALAEAAAAAGVSVMAATPHLRRDFPDVRVEEIAERCATLNSALEGRRAPRIASGGEVDLLWASQASSEQLVAASFDGRGTDLLVETPYGPLPPEFEELLFQLTLDGFRVLLAHPERNAVFQDDAGRLGALVSRGVLVQLTARSLVYGPSQSRLRRTAEAFVRGGLAHVIASDAHRPDGQRLTALAHAARAVDSIAPGLGRWMTAEAPAAVLAGAPLPPPPRQPPKKRGWRSFRPFGASFR